MPSPCCVLGCAGSFRDVFDLEKSAQLLVQPAVHLLTHGGKSCGSIGIFCGKIQQFPQPALAGGGPQTFRITQLDRKSVV